MACQKLSCYLVKHYVMRNKFIHECIFTTKRLENITALFVVFDDSCHIQRLFPPRSKPGRRPLDVVFSFDTTLSMVGVVERVRQDIEFIATRLFKDIPDLRIAVFAHGDYDTPNYIIQCLDFTDNTQEVVRVGYMRYRTYIHVHLFIHIIVTVFIVQSMCGPPFLPGVQELR